MLTPASDRHDRNPIKWGRNDFRWLIRRSMDRDVANTSTLEPTKRVRMNTDGLRECVAGDIDAACHFVGDFAFCAREQGWTTEEIRRVVGRVTAKRAYDELMPH